MKRLIILSVFVFLTLCCGVKAIATNSTVADVNGRKYVLYDNGTAAWKAQLYGDEIEQDTIKIPDFIQYQGKKYPVVEIVSRDDNLIQDEYVSIQWVGILKKYHTFVLGNNVKTIGPNAFCYMPMNGFDSRFVETICDSAFHHSSIQKNTEMNLNGVKKLGQRAFYGMAVQGDSTTLTIPASVETIGEGAISWIIVDTLKVLTSEKALFYRPFKVNSRDVHSMKCVCVIGDNIKEIPNNCFFGCYLREVILPNGLTKIDEKAFYSAIISKVINLPNSVQRINEYAFSSYNIRISADLPQSLEYVGEGAFRLSSFNSNTLLLPPHLKRIDALAFRQVQTLKCVSMPVSLEFIGDYAFSTSSLSDVVWGDSNPYVCSKAFNGSAWATNGNNEVLYAGQTALKYVGNKDELYTVEIKEGTKMIAAGCFANAKNLNEVLLPESVTELGDSAFLNCTKLEDINGLDNFEMVGKNALYGTKWYNNQPNGLVYAGKVAYYYKGTMPLNTSITLEANTTYISGSCFEGQNGLTAIDCGNSIIGISEKAFKDCANLKTLKIDNKNMSSLGDEAFFNCSLSEIYLNDIIGWITFDKYSTQQPSPKRYIYAGDYGAIYYNYFKDQQTSYNGGTAYPTKTPPKASSVFVNNSPLSGIIVPDGTTHITTYPLTGCTSLKTIYIPASCCDISSVDYVFRSCGNIENIVVEDNNPVYRSVNGALARYVLITDEHYSFYYDESGRLQRKTVQNNNYHWILERASKNTLVVPSDILRIEGYAFQNTHIKSVTFEEGVESIGEYAFDHCDFKRVVLPNSLLYLDRYAFNWCNNLEEVVIGPQKPVFGAQPFVNCAKLKTFRLYIKDPSVFTGNASSSVFPAGSVIYVPRGSGASYRNTAYFEGYEIIEFDDAPKGDIDGNGVVNGIDLNTMINFILGKSSPSATQLEIADFDGDGAIDGTDLNQMINTILGQ